MITTHQIRNVLRIHGDQLKRRNTPVAEKGDSDRQPRDFVNISIEARRKQMMNQISSDLISEISSKGKTDQEPKGSSVDDNIEN